MVLFYLHLSVSFHFLFPHLFIDFTLVPSVLFIYLLCILTPPPTLFCKHSLPLHRSSFHLSFQPSVLFSHRVSPVLCHVRRRVEVGGWQLLERLRSADLSWPLVSCLLRCVTGGTGSWQALRRHVFDAVVSLIVEITPTSVETTFNYTYR